MGTVAGTTTGLVQPLSELVQVPAVRLGRSWRIQFVPVAGDHETVAKPGLAGWME